MAAQPAPDTPYVVNPAVMFHEPARHPLGWPPVIIRWLAIPRPLPRAPAPLCALPPHTSFPDYLTRLIPAPCDPPRSPEDFRRLFAHTVHWLKGPLGLRFRNTLDPYLDVDRRRYDLPSVRTLAGARTYAPFLVYIDAHHRQDERMKRRGHPSWRSVNNLDAARHVLPAQDDDAVDVFDLAVLVGMAQMQRARGIPGCVFTTRVVYPDCEGTGMILLTARVWRETLDALDEHRDTLRKIELTKAHLDVRSVPGDWETNQFLRVMWTIVRSESGDP
ncbi:hypothetical protein BV25DRAFT_1825988 [Artomyces pyxidatus]|uniref:Uncharacterized protein n=1 Tax=Artomyces pyxidatus TaxID=48021 RepID=A0ACB8SZY3_9AGAM|nr:hypothetical protein BV25DRAFT_1825988 [Artomyces pyxidatus]